LAWRSARPWVTLAVIADLRIRFGLRDLEPETEMTMTDDRMALIELVEKQADGDLVREMLTFAAERIMEAEVEARTGAAKGAQLAESSGAIDMRTPGNSRRLKTSPSRRKRNKRSHGTSMTHPATMSPPCCGGSSASR